MRNLCKTKSTAGNSKPSLSNPDDYVCMGQYTHDKAEFTGFYLMKGEAYGKLKIPSFILTPSCQLNLRNIVRAAAPHRYPILLQGPTSAGKTSMIEYLAASTGHEFVRINNHAHTDVQEYLGGYASDRFGKLVFCEGPLVKALRGGHWLVLDELNLAPSEVLEMLNRLLDDNRELLIPETQETVKPHPHFMLFATQNPAGGAYGGRKMMSRAFRNRFLEVHVDDIPHEELKEMIEKRCKIPPSRAERIVGVMRELHRRRQRSNVFAGRHAFVTPRDLFKWADRIAAAATDSYDLMAQEGYMLLAEGLRRKEEKECVQDVLQKIVKVSVDIPTLYSGGWDLDVGAMLSGRPARASANTDVAQGGAFEGLVHTKSAKRLLRLVARCMRFQEPVLLVGETGTGKTTVCQAFATALGNKLHIVNCHQNSETSDLIGGFRPIRGKDAAIARFRSLLERYYTLVREAWAPVRSTADGTDASNGVHKSADDSMQVEDESGLPTTKSKKNTDSDSASEEEEEKMPPMPIGALPQESQEWLSRGEVSTDDGAPSNMPSEGWISRADVMDLIGQFENSWESVHPLLKQLSRCHAAAEAAAEDNAEVTEIDGAAKVPQQLKALALQVEEQVPNCRALFTWYDGPLVTAMRDGDLLLIDEISLADDSVLERLNSVLEPSRTLTIAEKGGEVIVAHAEFRVLATMNPGGDFGKKELSPALRNRFTEIWIDAISDMDDLRSILAAHLKPSLMQTGDGDRLLKFWGWIIAKDGGAMRRLLSLRDLLSWTHFMNMAQEQGLNRTLGFLHGASMVLLDGLGVGDGSSDRRARSLRDECYAFLLQMIPEDERVANLGSTTELISGAQKVTTSATAFGMHPFHIPMGPEPEVSSFSMTAPTTSQNLVRVLRGLQLKRPILLEGSPGVGKTTLIQALASVTGHRLVRINLSDQTDMMDLLGTDLPVDGGGGGGAQFAWSDGVFLSALKAGDWVLLDELNLASQSVLEGLNACLDHRAEVYLPELGQTFACPPSFRIFAAQNPLHQGGGRKGLPASFLNRFTSVRVEELNADDLLFIALAAYPDIGEDLLRRMISFNVAVHHHVTYVFAISGRPWEFNLRDIFRWCELMCAHQDAGRWVPEQFIEVLYSLRLRTARDREKLDNLYCTHFGVTLTKRQSIPFRVTPQTLQVGGATLQRTAKRELNSSTSLILPGLLQPLEALMYCVRMGWMGIIVGPPAVGKTSLVRILASYTGNHLREVAMTSDTDTTDLLGCFEQVDVQRKRRNFVVAFNSFHEQLMRALFTWQGNNPQALAFMAELSGSFSKLRGTSLNGHPQASTSLDNPAAKAGGDTKQSAGFSAEQAVMLSHLLTMATQGLHNFTPASANTDPDVRRQVAELTDGLKGLATELEVLKVIERERVTGCFEWMDGILVQALETGDWVLLDNVNLCNPTVLDRLNPLLEPGGVLMVNERGLVNGQVTIVKPHPNFRLFLCLDPQRGEISRAMRNRGVEMCLLDSQLGSKDLMLLLSSLGLPGCELPTVMIEHHYELVKISRQALGPALTVRHLIKWVKMLVATLPRGVPLSQAWPAATELVYSACGSSERWRRESSAASAAFLLQVPLRILDACPHETTGLVRATLQQRNALHANILRDSMALQTLVRKHLKASVKISAKGVDLKRLSVFERRCLDLALLLNVPIHQQLLPISNQTAEQKQLAARDERASLMQSVQVAVRLFLGQTSPADWERRMSAIDEMARGQPEGEVRSTLLAAKEALQQLAQHTALLTLMNMRRQRALQIAAATSAKKGAVPLVVDEMAFDLRGDPQARGVDAGAVEHAQVHEELMTACALVLQRAMRDAIKDSAAALIATSGDSEPARRGVAGRLQTKKDVQDDLGGGLDDQVHQWLDALLMRVDACIAQWLHDAAKTVAACAARGTPLEQHPATSASVMKLLVKLTAHRDDMGNHAKMRGQDLDTSADARLGGGVSWLSTMLVMWRWFLKDAAALMQESGVPIQIQSLKGGKKKSAPSHGATTMSDVSVGIGMGVEWPSDVRGLLSHLDESLPTHALQGTPLWLYGGHPKMLSTLDLQQLAGAFENTCKPFGFAWSGMLDANKAAGALADDEDARRFPVALLCLDEEYRQTALQGHAALMCVNNPKDSEALLQRLADAPGWLLRDGEMTIKSALGHEASHLVGPDGCTAIPVPVDVTRFTAWKAALWPALDHQCLLHELSLLSSIARALLGVGGASPVELWNGEQSQIRVLSGLSAGHLETDVKSYISRHLADSSRSPLEFSPYQQLVWEMRRAAAQDELGRSGAAGMDMARAGGLLTEMMMRWHARTWNASFTRAAEVAMAPVLPFDYTPSRRERERVKARAKEDAMQRGGVHVDTARLGPMLLRLPIKTLHAALLNQRWEHTTISNRSDALQQMRRAAALHLQGTDAEHQDGIGREEWVLLGHLLVQFVGCHAHLLEAQGWSLLRPRILHLCALVSGTEGEEAGGKKGVDKMQDAQDILGTCQERRGQEVLVTMIAPALQIFASAVHTASKKHDTNIEHEDLLAKGQVWGLLGAARVRLVLPELPVDPASKFAVKLRMVERKLSQLQAELKVRELQSSLSPGSLPDAAALECQTEIEKLTRRGETLRKKLVPRPTGEKAPSFEHLFGELQRFATTLTSSPAKLERLLSLAPAGARMQSRDERAALMEEERHMQDVAGQLCGRLEGGEWKGFEDVTAPLALGVY